MKTILGIAGAMIGCVGGAPPDPMGGGGDLPRTCPLPDQMADTGSLAATAAQHCNVSGTAGAMHWYRVASALPSGAMDYVQIELWDNKGAFAAGAVHTGTFTISGADADFSTCGVCVR